MTTPVQGTPRFPTMSSVSPVSNDVMKITRMALGKVPSVPQALSEEITTALKMCPTELKKASSTELTKVGDKIPENEWGIMGGVVSSMTTARGQITQKVIGQGQAVFDEEHVIYRGEFDRSTGVSQRILPKH